MSKNKGNNIIAKTKIMFKKFLYFHICYETRFENDNERYRGDFLLKLKKGDGTNLDSIREKIKETIRTQDHMEPIEVVILTITPLKKGIFNALGGKEA